MERQLEEFLLERGAVTESILEEMKEQKIEMETVLHMSSEQLQKYVPKVGDQIALTNFCRRHRFSAPSCSKSTQSLIQRLKRGNFGEGSALTEQQPESKINKTSSPGRPIQDSRKIRMGWKMDGKMVREIRGGGCRLFTAKKEMTKADLLQNALNLFFPNGSSKFGPLENYRYDLLDYQENAIDDNLTVGQMYEASKLSTLRFYLATNSLTTNLTTSKSTKRAYSYDDDYSNSALRPKTRRRRRRMVSGDSPKTSKISDDETLNEFLSFNTGDSHNNTQRNNDGFENVIDLEELLENDVIISEHQQSEMGENFSKRVDIGEFLDDRDLETEFQRDLEKAINDSLLTIEENSISLNVGSHQSDNEIVSKSPDQMTGPPADIIMTSLSEIIKELHNKVNENSVSKFNVYRSDIFRCCTRALHRKNFSPFNKISVMFSDIEGNSEGAVDAGGPTRELFRLVIDHIKNSRMFFGDKQKYLALDGDALQKQEYFDAGRLIALSLIHGGPGPHFFSQSLYAVLLHGFSTQHVSINEVEHEFREKILKVKSYDNLRTLQDYVSEEPVFSIAGWPIISSLEDKDMMMSDIIKFYAYERIRPALEQFREGLNTGGIFDLIKSYPHLFESAMCSSKVAVTANKFNNIFSVVYSEPSSSQRQLENRAISFWRDLLLDCEDAETDLTIQNILVFATGADCIPPLGFLGTPTITFIKESLYPTANTCGLELRIPIAHSTYEEFKTNVVFGILNCTDFAFA